MSMGALQQKLEQVETNAEDGHTRLRQDYRELDARVTADLLTLRKQQSDLAASLRIEMKAAQIDVTNLRMSPATVVAIIAVVLSLGGGYLTLRDAISELRKGQQLQDLKVNELTNKVLDAIRVTKGPTP